MLQDAKENDVHKSIRRRQRPHLCVDHLKKKKNSASRKKERKTMRAMSIKKYKKMKMEGRRER